jgi:hypothetical protein
MRYFLQVVPLIETHLLVTALLVAGSVAMAGLGWYLGWTIERQARRALQGLQTAWSQRWAAFMAAIVGPVLQLTPTPLILLPVAAFVVHAGIVIAHP